MNANKDRIYQDVEFLTSITPSRNFQHLKSLEKAAGYIKNEFKKSGLKPVLQTWKAQGKPYKNVMASVNPEKKRRLIVGAHYDVCGDQPGADDNASGVAGLLELARLMAEHLPKMDYRVDFIAYCLEEPPFFGTTSMGSYVHARSLSDNNSDVIGMISLEMIGYFSDAPESQSFPSPDLAAFYPHTANFIIVVGIKEYEVFSNRVHKLMSTGSAIDVQLINLPSSEGLAGLSDQRNYWVFGYNGLMINDTSFIRNPHYHKKSDTIRTLDFKRMTAVVNSCYRAITGIVNSEW